MVQKHRISTNIGRDQRVNVDIKQNFDILEILSLKFTQKDIYASGACSEYGVVVGRVSANNGFGIPNAKISIFIPQTSTDSIDPVISKLYPYQEISEKDEDGYRYNLLPERKQHSGHEPTGTFPDQEDILSREEVLEVFETYYKYTVKTNQAGDFMIWGVPIGVQTIHVDIDLSDIGCFSLRPYDFIKAGFGENEFERFYKFKSSPDMDGLPQIITFNRSIEVYPLWGNEDLCDIGISRTDFDLSEKGITINPISLILISSITDDSSDAVKRNGKIRKNTGFKCNLQTSGGYIECVRQTGKTVYGSNGVTTYPELEYFTIAEVIDEDGVAMAALPMNLEYVYTDEFGVEQITNDQNKGIPTTAIARFRLSLDFIGSKVATANYLVPNIREFNPSNDGVNNKYEYYEGMVASYIFSDVFEDYLIPPTPEGLTLNSTGYDNTAKTNKKELMLGTNNNGIPEDYFYKFIYGKVYTVSSFQGTHYETGRRDAFLGIKQIRPSQDEDCASSANYIPTNFGYKNRAKFALLLAQVILFVQYIFAAILIKFSEIIGKFFYDLSRLFFNIGIRKWRPFRKISERFENAAYNMQEKFTKQLPLTIYPDCEECTSDSDSQTEDTSFLNDYCRVGELKMKVSLVDRKVRLVSTGSTTDFLNLITQNSFLTTGINELFPGEMARDPEGLCTLADTITYDSGAFQLKNLNDIVISPTPDDGIPSRYIVAVYPFVNSWVATGTTLFSDFIGYLNTTSPDIDVVNQRFFYTTPGGVPSICLGNGIGAGSERFFTYEEFNELTGADFDILPAGVTEHLYAVARIYDRSRLKGVPVTGSTLNVEDGCLKYDKTYNEDITLGYIYGTGSTYEPVSLPTAPDYLPGTNDNFISYSTAPGFREYLKTQTPPAPYSQLMSTIIASSGSGRLPLKKYFKKIPNATYDRKTKSGWSEFRDGIFTIIPVINGRSYNLLALQEWYRRKRIGLAFCGGVVNYSFIDNWLNGLLYFFKFDKRVRWDNEGNYDLNQRGTKFPRELIFYNILDKKFYYRSCPYDYNSENFIGQLFDDKREILHPTTFYDVGVRDEFLNEICLDPRVDPNCSVIRDISTTSYQDPATIAEYAINYRLDVSDGDFDIDDFFSGSNYGSNIKVLDGDITQLMSINCETGIEAFDLDSPHYFMYNGDYLDPESLTYAAYFKQGANFNPIPIDLKFDFNGTFVRGCLNYRLGDYSQVVPFYLWNKGGEGFGPAGDDSDNQTWDKGAIASMKLQRLFSVSGYTLYDLGTPTIPGHSNYVMSNGEEEYLLKPITINHNTYWWYGDFEDSLERFEKISYDAPSHTGSGEAQSLMGYNDGQLWLEVTGGSLSDPIHGNLWVVVNSTWVQSPGYYYEGSYETFLPQTVKNYVSNRQVLSTPFLFYFGLKPGSTSLDILTKYFGSKDAFGTTEVQCPTFGTTPTPSQTSAPGSSVPPTPQVSGISTVTPTPTPTRTIPPAPSSAGTYYYFQADTYECLEGRTEPLPCEEGGPLSSVWIYCDESVLALNRYYYNINDDRMYKITSGSYTEAGWISQGSPLAYEVVFFGPGNATCLCPNALIA